MNNKLLIYFENSFLSPLLVDEEITDISYNGTSLFYVHNQKGRIKSSITVSQTEVIDFLRQIANLSEKQFSYAVPILDVSVNKYRINGVHPSIGRNNNEKVCTFSIRISSAESRLKKDKHFMSEECKLFLKDSIDKGKSIVIAGPTGSGKTELQKYLLSELKDNTRVIVIDNVQELENLRSDVNIDLTSWQVSQFNESASIEELISNALRSNPDWIVVAEARGKEMSDVLNSAMTGHPIITTVHAKSIESIPNRLAKLILLKDNTQKYSDILGDIYEFISVYVYLNRRINEKGKVIRYVEAIGEMHDGKLNIIYKNHD